MSHSTFPYQTQFLGLTLFQSKPLRGPPTPSLYEKNTRKNDFEPKKTLKTNMTGWKISIFQ